VHRKSRLLGLAAVFCVIAISCVPPVTPGVTHFYITGNIYDGMNGAPVPGAIFRYGSASGAAEADGSFSVDLGTTAGVFSEPMGFSAPGSSFMYIDAVRVDTAESNTLVIRLKPLSDFLYTTKDAHCTIYETNGTTEITDATRVLLAVLPMNGIVGASETTAYSAGYYTLQTKRHSANCLVLIWVERPDSTQSFFAHRANVDLSGSEPINLRFDQPTTGYSGIDLTADATDSYSEGLYTTPYGLFPVVVKYVDDDGLPGPLPVTRIRSNVEFSDGITESLTVYNPDNWQCYWSQRRFDAAYPGTSVRVLMSTTAIAAMPPALTLPVVGAGLGPNADPNLGSWLYTAVTGTLSIDAITDTQIYQYVVVNTEATPDINIGTIVSFGNSLVLPVWLNAIVREDSPRNILMQPMETDLAGYNLEMVSRDNYPPSSHFGVLISPTFSPYSKDFAF
jgi:hypothetical protein